MLSAGIVEPNLRKPYKRPGEMPGLLYLCKFINVICLRFNVAYLRVLLLIISIALATAVSLFKK